jgi:hypothetical protein
MRWTILATSILAVGACSPEAMHGGLHHAAAPVASAAPQDLSVAPNGDVTINIQGRQQDWANNSHMRAFYALSAEMLGTSARGLDFADYRDRSYAIFREFGVSMGMSPEGMVDHLKAIPGQMVEIVKDDPKVLDSYDNFVVALMGPQ